MSTNYATTEPAANVIPLASLLPPIKTYQTPEKLQTLPQDNDPTTSAYAEPLTDQVSNSTYCINDTSYSTIYCIL